MKKSKKIILISFLTIFVIFGLAFVAIAIKNYKRVSLPLGLNDLGQTEKKDSDHTSKGTQAGIKKNVDDSSSIVTFESEDTKNQFLKENNLKNEQLKNIPNTQSYYLPLPIEQIKKVEGVSINENKIYRALATPNDPLFSSQWHLSKISAPGAWDVTTGSGSTKVAILDTGFALNHQDLSSKFDSTNAWDFVHNDNSPMVGTDNWNGQFVYHGTMMAGLVGAATNNGVGIASIGWNVRVLPVQVLDDNGYGDTYTVASAINYAVSKGAKVISLSLGVPDPDSVVRSAIANATNNGVVVVAAAGNSNCNCIIYPANYPEVIAVGASDSNDNRASFSNYGPNLDVVAPGVGTIRTTYVSQSNQTSSYTTSAYGTSISTPIVAGLAGLIKSARPGVSSSEVENYIRNGADKVSAMNGQNFTYEYGYGRINAYKSLGKYQWQYVGQSGSWSLIAGQKTTWTVFAKNSGTEAWYNSGANPVRLGTSNPNDRLSTFCTTGWSNCNRVATLNEDSVPPGSVGTFTFTVQAPVNPGAYREYFNLVADGATWMNNIGLYFEPTVSTGNFSGNLVSNNFPSTLSADGTASVVILIKNNGNTYWYKDGKYPIALGTYSPIDRNSAFYNNSWLSPNRPAIMNESIVGPGQDATFSFNIKAPSFSGSYQESFSLVAESYKWFNQPIISNTFIAGSLSPPAPTQNQFIEVLNAGQSLSTNQILISPDGRYKLIMQSDGNLVLYSPNRPLWWSGTWNKPVNLFAVQTDSNLVLYDAQAKYHWASWTQGRGGSKLIMQNDGNLVLYTSNGIPVWYTNTAGKI